MIAAKVESKGAEISLSLKIMFLFMALVILGTFSGDPGLITFALVFVSIVLEALPFMLLGSMISGFVEVFLSKERLAGLLPRRKAVLTLFAAGMGVVFPVCECAIVPVVRRFLRKGVPLSAAIAYLLAGPIFNPVVGASTFVAYASQSTGHTLAIVAIRLLSGFAIAFVIGLIMGKLFPGESALVGKERGDARSDGEDHQEAHNALNHENPEHHEEAHRNRPALDPCHAHDHEARGRSPGMRILQAVNHGVEDFLDVTQYLVIGAFIAGLLQALVSRQVFLDLAAVPLAAIPLMMLLAFVLNLCSEADAFLAASFRGTLPLSAQMAFMVLGPMLDIKLIVMYLGVFRKRTIVVLALLIAVLVFAVMMLLQGWLGPWYGAPALPGGMGP